MFNFLRKSRPQILASVHPELRGHLEIAVENRKTGEWIFTTFDRRPAKALSLKLSDRWVIQLEDGSEVLADICDLDFNLGR